MPRTRHTEEEEGEEEEKGQPINKNSKSPLKSVKKEFLKRYPKNDLLFHLWQKGFMLFYGNNVELNVDLFLEALLYYLGFCDFSCDLNIVQQIKIGKGRSRGDLAVGFIDHRKYTLVSLG